MGKCQERLSTASVLCPNCGESFPDPNGLVNHFRFSLCSKQVEFVPQLPNKKRKSAMDFWHNYDQNASKIYEEDYHVPDHPNKNDQWFHCDSLEEHNEYLSNQLQGLTLGVTEDKHQNYEGPTYSQCLFCAATMHPDVLGSHMLANHAKYKKVTKIATTDNDSSCNESANLMEEYQLDYDEMEECNLGFDTFNTYNVEKTNVEDDFDIVQYIDGVTAENAVTEVLQDYRSDLDSVTVLRSNNEQNWDLWMDDQRLLCHVKLLDLLTNNNAPLYLFNEIMQWARTSAIANKFDFQLASIPRERLVKTLIKNNGLHGLLPKVINFTLPKAGVNVRVTTHNILFSIQSLLNDKELMMKENLIFDDNPLEDPCQRSTRTQSYKDINDGTCYLDAYNYYCKNKTTDVLCPLIFFVDKTHADFRGNIKLEPVMMTLGIFNKYTRNRENAWRTIGFIPNLDNVSNENLTADDKADDYHALLKVILAPLVDLQNEENVIEYVFDYNGVLYPVVLKVPILFVTGDSEGQDKLVGRIANYSSNKDTARVCRYCDIPANVMDDPLLLLKKRFNRTQACVIETLLRHNNEFELKRKGYRVITENVLHQLQFCDRSLGVNGSVPADLLHTLQHGLYLYMFEELLNSKQLKLLPDEIPNKRNKPCLKYRKGKLTKKVVDNNDDDDTYDSSESRVIVYTDDQKSKNNVFDNKRCDRVDNLARIIGKQLQHQSDRDLPITYFSSGITSEKKKQAQQEQGVIIVWMFIFLSVDKKDFISLFGQPRYNNWLYVMERLLMIEQFMKADLLSKEIVGVFKHWILVFLDTFRDVIDRKSGKKMKVLKFHLLTHLADDIMKFGVPISFNSATGESNHKSHKKRAKRTQQVHDTLEEQVGVRYIEQLAIQKSLDCMLDIGGIRCESNIHTTSNDATIGDFCLGGLNKFFMNENGIFETAAVHVNDNQNIWPDSVLQKEIFSFLRHHVCPHLQNQKVKLMTMVKTEDCLYRADPKFSGKPWHDWAYIDWGEENGGEIPVHLLIFVQVEFARNGALLEVNGVGIDKTANCHAIVHMIERQLDKSFAAFEKSKLFFTAKKMLHRGKPMLAMVAVNSIKAPCIAVNVDPTSIPIEQPGQYQYNFLKPRSSWVEEFEITMSEMLDK